jgi:hypothetical protein
MKDTFILNEIWARDKIYFRRHFAWVKYFTYHLVFTGTGSCKQHISSPGKVTKQCYSLSEPYVRSVYLNLFSRREA